MEAISIRNVQYMLICVWTMKASIKFALVIESAHLGLG